MRVKESWQRSPLNGLVLCQDGTFFTCPLKLWYSQHCKIWEAKLKMCSYTFYDYDICIKVGQKDVIWTEIFPFSLFPWHNRDVALIKQDCSRI